MAPRNLQQLATASADNSGHHLRPQFNHDASRFCTVSQPMDKHRVQIWDTERTGACIADISDDRFPQISALCWTRVSSTLVNPTPQSAKKKKRRTAASDSASTIQLDILVMGAQNGGVYWYSPSHASIVREFPTGHTHAVTGCAVAHQQMVTCDDAGTVCTWDLMAAGSVVQKSWRVKNGLDQVLIRKDGSIVCARNAIDIYSADSSKSIQSHTGHATSVSGVLEDGDALFSFAEQDRFMNVWKAGSDAPVGALACESNVVGADAMGGMVLAVTEEGHCNIWVDAAVPKPAAASQKKKRASRSRTSDCSVHLLNATGKSASVPVLCAKFLSATQIIVACGLALRPQFETISFVASDNGAVMKQVQVPVTVDQNLINTEATMLKEVQKMDARSSAYTETAATVLGQTDFGLSAIKYDDEDNNAVVSDREDDESAAPEPTIEDKIKALSMDTLTAQSGNKNQSRRAAIPKAESLQQMLVQALHSNDSVLLEECLQIHDLSTIDSTVRRLPASYILPFLQQCVARFQSRPSRARVLSRWVRVVLVTHMAYLMTQPELTSTLAPLYQTVDARVGVFKKLLRLQGRLDVLEQQIRLRTSAAADRDAASGADEALLQEPAVVYDENEEEDWSEESEGDNDDDVAPDEMSEDDEDDGESVQMQEASEEEDDNN